MKGLPIRKEVQAFCESSETLLAPALPGAELTPEECILIADYVLNLADWGKPWGMYFLITVRNSIQRSS
jgi:hypothetical protein